MGSCFAEHIGCKLLERKFRLALNPFGIVYNPVSLAHNLQKLATKDLYTPQDLFLHLERWHSFDHHSQFSQADQAATLARINEALQEARALLSSPTVLLLSLGTAFVFKDQKSGKIVANCHKLPGQTFKRYRLDVAQVVDALAPALEQLKKQSPDLCCILTVSPVRHLRDGLVDNQRSKATLLLAAEALSPQFDWLYYFPAYELLLDDLRDYRFFAPDMAHPNQQAIDYIWSHFSQTCFDENTLSLIARIEKILTACQHRPFHPESAAHQRFLQQTLTQIEALEREFSFLDFRRERKGLGMADG